MIVDPVDREREEIAAGGLEHDQRALVVAHRAVEAEHVGEADLGHAAAADGGDPCPADAFERDDSSRWRGRSPRSPSAGMAKCWLPIDTVSAGMMVRVSGTRRVMRVPAPGVLSTSTMPPIRSTLERTTSMPTPRPEMAVTACAVDRPGLEDQRELLARARARRPRPWSSVPAGDRLSRPAACRRCRGRRRRCRSGSGCPTGAPRPTACRSRACRPCSRSAGRFDAVVDRVADDVGQRIADHLDHLAVELDVAALDIDQHLLAELGRQVADHARQARRTDSRSAACGCG